MRNICTINKKTKTNPQYLVQCLRFDGFYYNSQLSTICAMLKQSAKPRSYASITWSSRDFYVTPNRAGSTCSLNKQWPRGKVKHCPISKNLISSFTARCDLPAQSWARNNLKKGRTLPWQTSWAGQTSFLTQVLATTILDKSFQDFSSSFIIKLIPS